MDLQTMLDNALTARRYEEMKSSLQLTLGEIILKLENMPPDAPVRFDFDSNVGGLDSWRGSYSELALGYQDDEPITVNDLLNDCRFSVGKTYEGYKGGEFKMGRQTPVWVANWGESGASVKDKYDYETVGIKDIALKDGAVIIVTEKMEY